MCHIEQQSYGVPTCYFRSSPFFLCNGQVQFRGRDAVFFHGFDKRCFLLVFDLKIYPPNTYLFWGISSLCATETAPDSPHARHSRISKIRFIKQTHRINVKSEDLCIFVLSLHCVQDSAQRGVSL